MSKYGKIGTIIQHEYLSKVKSKGFILGTVLAPLGIILVFGAIIFITIISKDDTNKKLAIIDNSNQIAEELVRVDTAKYFIASLSEAEVKQKVVDKEYDGYVVIPADFIEEGDATVFTRGGGGLGLITSLDDNLSDIVRERRLKSFGADEEVIKLIEKGVSIDTKKITEEGETKEDSTAALAFVGYIMGFLIYGLMFLYGGWVMRGVIEEKANRIVEVIASSARPFEIMFGKVVGIGAVGLTQVLFWVVLGTIVFALIGPIASMFVDPADMAQTMQQSSTMPGQEVQAQPNLPFSIPEISPLMIIGFIFYFLAGYFLYSTLFAAVGSAVDQEQDANQLLTPVTIPLIIPIMFVFNLMNNPDSTWGVVLSIIPFFSPILMTVRIAATEVPFWQIALSVVLLIATFFGALWVAAKIYRVGILSYGKKPSFKDLGKWIVMKD